MSNVGDVREQYVKIMLDKERILKYDLNAFAELEEAYGDIEKAMEEAEKGSVKAIRKLLWAGLIHEDENLTEKQVGAMVDFVKLQQFSAEIFASIAMNMPQPKEQEEGQTPN